MQTYRDTKIIKHISDDEVWNIFFKKEMTVYLEEKRINYCLHNYFQVDEHHWWVTNKGTIRERTMLYPTGAYYRCSKVERSK